MRRITLLSFAALVAPFALAAQQSTDRKSGQGAPLKLAELKPGDVIRVAFGGRPTGFVAYTIERVGRMDVGVEHAP